MPLATGPDAPTLLGEALEKLLYLESRLEAAEAARDDAVRDRDRQRATATQARRATVDWQRRATAAEAAAEGAEREVALLRGAVQELQKVRETPPETDALRHRLQDAEERLSRFDREREAWIDRMVAAERLRSGGDDDELDLGSFIAEMRAELMALRRGEPPPSSVPGAGGPPPLDVRALLDEASSPPPDPAALLEGAGLSRPERTLALLCARDLESPSAAVRRRALERLAQAGVRALDPLVAARLADEPDPAVRCAAVSLLGSGAGDGAALVLGRSLGDEDTRVRAAAVKALAGRATYDLRNAFTDEAPAVRRLAVALLPRDASALERIADAMGDDDASVRRVAALALAGRTGAEADAMLRVAAGSSDREVAAIAEAAVRRRGMVPDPVQAPAEPPKVGADEARPAAEAAADADRSRAQAPVAPEETLAVAIVEQVRSALRGRSIEELSADLKADPADVAAAVFGLAGDGRLVWRGSRLYPP